MKKQPKKSLHTELLKNPVAFRMPEWLERKMDERVFERSRFIREAIFEKLQRMEES